MIDINNFNLKGIIDFWSFVDIQRLSSMNTRQIINDATNRTIFVSNDIKNIFSKPRFLNHQKSVIKWIILENKNIKNQIMATITSPLQFF